MNKTLQKHLIGCIPVKSLRKKVRYMVLPIEDKLSQSRIPAMGSDFKEYILNNDMSKIIPELKKGLDSESLKHLDFMLDAIMNFPSDSKGEGFFLNKPIREFYPDWMKEEASIAEMETKKMWKDGFWGGYECNYYKHGLALLSDKANEFVKGKDCIDLGSFDGDSATLFDTIGFSKIFSFDISQRNIDKFKEKTNLKTDSEVFKVALSNKKGSFQYSDNGTWGDSLKTSKGPDTIEAVKLDDFIKDHPMNIGFLKADIEGAEPDMLAGALETIKNQRPIISLSIYHDPISFFEMKKTIEDLNANYKFKMRVLGFYENGPINEACLIAYPEELDN